MELRERAGGQTGRCMHGHRWTRFESPKAKRHVHLSLSIANVQQTSMPCLVPPPKPYHRG